MIKGEVNNCHSHNMESDDDEGANGDVCYDRMLDAIENLAAIEHTKEKTNICRIEKNNMQHVLI